MQYELIELQWYEIIDFQHYFIHISYFSLEKYCEYLWY